MIPKPTRLALLLLCLWPLLLQGQPESHAQRRASAVQDMQDGNYQDAYKVFRALALDPDDQPAKAVGQDLHNAIACLQRLNRLQEVDALREAAIETHSGNWQLLRAAAKSYLRVYHHGVIIDNAFQRGARRGRGQWVSSEQRDRSRALQLYQQAIEQSTKAPPHDRARLHVDFARALVPNGANWDTLWRLQVLTPLDSLPDRQAHQGDSFEATPAQADGSPIYYHLPDRWEAAKNDGERWRWLLRRAAQLHDAYEDTNLIDQARLYQRLYGVQTLAANGRRTHPFSDENKTADASPYGLRHLDDNETIARLATGVARFSLPDEFNHIRLYQKLLDSRPRTAHERLARIFANRQQYTKAAEHVRRLIDIAPSDNHRRWLDAIVGNWGRFEPDQPQAAGQAGELFFRFRNAHALDLTVYRIDRRRLLRDIKQYIRTSPRRFDYKKVDINRIGYRLVTDNQKQFLVERVAQWTEQLQPKSDHFDDRIRIETPVKKAGAYLVVGKLKNGNTSRVVLWLNDTVLMRKPLDEQWLYYAADARDGRPIEDMTLSFFGFKRESVRMPKPLNRLFYKTRIEQVERQTDDNGLVVTDEGSVPHDYQWLITAHDPSGRLAILGLQRVWYQDYPQHHYGSRKHFGVTDRPVYRPGHAVDLKLWSHQVGYTKEQTGLYRNRPVTLRVLDPQGNVAFETKTNSNEVSGAAAQFTLEDEATLGVYRFGLARVGSKIVQAGTFRVEEYKKPEFEVKLATPEEAVMLGETIDIQLEARYYFGEPVTEGKVTYKILRYTHTDRWYPPSRWDWLYGRGFGWQAYAYDWYPGWQNWGCLPPAPPWLPARQGPPELVASNTLPLNPDGTVDIRLDTRFAKQVHGDQDHRYEIIAEVTDNSRRTIVSEESIIVARAPFKVRTWVDKGYYHSGDSVVARLKAITPNDQPVQGTGELSLLKIHYDDQGEPQETLLKQWPLTTDSQGAAHQRFVAGGPGQYRLAVTLSDGQGHRQPGGYVFTVTGENVEAQSFRFNPIEILTDHATYRPGQSAKLLINTRRPDSTVLVFLRPRDGIYTQPQVLRLNGKSQQLELFIEQRDMPNVFVEAITISDGKLYRDVREIAVPPQKRTLNVEVLSDKPRYRPGETAKLKVKVTDAEGEPVRGDTVLTVYDKAVEYIAGGSNVPAIEAFFWKWRYQHRPRDVTNLQRRFDNLLQSGETPMPFVGVFGELLGQAKQKEQTEMMLADAGVRQDVVQERAMAPAPAAEAKKAKTTEADTADPAFAEATLRKSFADTAFWSESVALNHAGIGEVEFTLAQDLTTWQIRSWSLAQGARVGQAEHSIQTFKNLVLRMQAPRFFVEKDEVVLSANIHNYLDTAQDIRAVLELEGGSLSALGATTREVRIDNNGEVRVDWRVKVAREGEAIIRMKALGPKESDAVQRQFPVYVHGSERFVSYTGSLQAEQQEERFTFEVPAARRIDSTAFTLQFSPSLATAMVDALPYLADYPYGCTEQTLNRFLPLVITRNTLSKMGIDLAALADKHTNLNAQQLGDPQQRAKQWQRYNRNPVFDSEEVAAMSRHGLQRLLAMQVSDGGWGWFSGSGERSYPHTTAYVMHGLYLARENGLNVPRHAYQRGLRWLQDHLQARVDKLRESEERHDTRRRRANNIDVLVYMVLSENDMTNEAMADYLYEDRTSLSVYTKAMLALAFDRQNKTEHVRMLQRNIEQYLVMDSENETAYLNLPNDGYWWYWYGSETEAHAYYLKLLARIEPESNKADWLVKYMINNRRHGHYWTSTRDTAIAIEAFAEYIAATGQHRPDLQVQIFVDDKPYKQVHITPQNLLTFDNRIDIKGDDLSAGEHVVRIEKLGQGPLFYSAYLSYFSLEDPIPAAGLEIKVKRRYYKLKAVEDRAHVAAEHGQAIAQKVEKFERIPLDDLDTVESGEKIEVELIIESKNDYEYVVIEDFKAAGLEPLNVRSGYSDDAYVEYRDERVSFFLRQLTRGTHSLRYRLYAEIPGMFSALPARGYAMYAPQLKGNAAEIKLRVTDAPR